MKDEKRPLLGVEEAQQRILSVTGILEPEKSPLLEATGRVLAETIFAEGDIPPLANSAMDGYAVRAADLKQTPGRLKVIGEVAAGYVSSIKVEPGTAMRIMTGAPIPPGADTVVRFENTHPASGSKPGNEEIEILVVPQPGDNVRLAGEDVRAGQVILQPGKVLRPQEIGMLASVGCTEVKVIRRPRVAILATGDEVITPGEALGPGQIHDSNSYTVAAQVRQFGCLPVLLGVARDQEMLIRDGLRQALARGADFIITSGGVSVGDFDLVKQVLAAEGEMHFWAINVKPGKPLAFGVLGPIEGSGARVPLLGLPGNPVSSMISTHLFARPALLKMQGCTDWTLPMMKARLMDAIPSKDRRRHYVRVSLQETPTGLEARLTGDQGSGILNSLVQADGLALIPEDTDHFEAGNIVGVFRI